MAIVFKTKKMKSLGFGSPLLHLLSIGMLIGLSNEISTTTDIQYETYSTELRSQIVPLDVELGTRTQGLGNSGNLTNNTTNSFNTHLFSSQEWQEEEKLPGLSRLVNFMLQSTMGQHYYFLRDNSTAGETDTIAKLFMPWGDLTVFEYNSELKELDKVIRGFYHVKNLRNVFVICSPQNTINLFQKLSIAVKQETKYEFLVSFINRVDKVSFHKVGFWHRNTSAGHLQYPLYQPLHLMYTDFGGRMMKNAVVSNPPYWQITSLPDGSIEPLAGIDYNILNTIAKKLNFTYKLILTEDSQWGGEQPDGSFSGMIGKVVRYEAHFAINEITLTAPRERVVDFTLPYFLESTVIASPAPAVKNRAFAVFSPFTAQVWMLIAVATLLIGPVITLMNWAIYTYIGGENSRMYSLSTLSFNMFRSLVNQGNDLPYPFWSLRILLTCWFFFCFLIFALYSGTLTAVLAIPSYEKPIDSLWDLLEAIKQYNYKPVVVFGTSNEFIFREATEGIYKQIWEVFDPKVGYAHTWDEGVERVLQGRYVFLNAHLGAEIRAKRLGLKRYYFARNTFYPQGYGIVCANGSPYKAVFERLLIRICSAGLVGKWVRDEVAKVKGKQVDDSKDIGAITLVQLQAAFFLLLIGYVIAAAVLIIEKILSHWNFFMKSEEPSVIDDENYKYK